MKHLLPLLIILFLILKSNAQSTWQSKFITIDKNNHLKYVPDAEGNTIPDFSKVGFASGEPKIPDVPVVETISPVRGDNRKNIQEAIDRVGSRLPDISGFRGTLLLSRGTYRVNGTLLINKSGIVIRGEGNGENGTVIIETATTKLDLFSFRGEGNRKTDMKTRTLMLVQTRNLSCPSISTYPRRDVLRIY